VGTALQLDPELDGIDDRKFGDCVRCDGGDKQEKEEKEEKDDDDDDDDDDDGAGCGSPWPGSPW
jgi:hypothetical protein